MNHRRRTLLLGARGQLATSLRRLLPPDGLTALGHEELDISDASRVNETIRALSPDVVINAAAMRRPDVCEENRERAFAVNALGPRNLALACSDVGAALVQVSSDNVFDGHKPTPYLEEDATNPINAYGVSKLAGEIFVRSSLAKHYIVRTSGLFGEGAREGQTNFVLTMLRQAKERSEVRAVIDQFVSPTYTVDLAQKIAWLVTTEAYETYHMANTGECSWHAFAQTIFRKAGIQARVHAITTEEFRPRAPRLRYAVLVNGTLRRMSVDDLRPWDDALDQYLRTL